MTAQSYRIDIYPDREAWLEARVGNAGEHRIGGSDVAAILGVSRFAGPWDVYNSRVLQLEEQVSASQEADFRRGHRLEDYTIAEYLEATGHELATPEGGIVHLSRGWQVGSPDALVVDTDGVKGGLEAKTARDAWEWGEDGAEIEGRYEETGGEAIVPPYYATQVYWYLDLSGLPWWDVAVLSPFYEVRSYRIWRCEHTQGRIRAAVTAWRQRHLVEGIEPDLDASEACKRAMEHRYQAGREAAKKAKRIDIATAEEAELMTAYVQARDAEKAAKATKGEAGNRLRRLIGERGAYGLVRPSGSGRITVATNGRITPSGF